MLTINDEHVEGDRATARLAVIAFIEGPDRPPIPCAASALAHVV
jgi:hypothetical protein